MTVATLRIRCYRTARDTEKDTERGRDTQTDKRTHTDDDDGGRWILSYFWRGLLLSQEFIIHCFFFNFKQRGKQFK